MDAVAKGYLLTPYVIKYLRIMQFVFRKKIAKLGFAKLRKAQCAERARFLHLQTTSPKSRSISNVYSLAAFTASLWPFCPFLACFWLPL